MPRIGIGAGSAGRHRRYRLPRRGMGRARLELRHRLLLCPLGGCDVTCGLLLACSFAYCLTACRDLRAGFISAGIVRLPMVGIVNEFLVMSSRSLTLLARRSYTHARGY